MGHEGGRPGQGISKTEVLLVILLLIVLALAALPEAQSLLDRTNDMLPAAS